MTAQPCTKPAAPLEVQSETVRDNKAERILYLSIGPSRPHSPSEPQVSRLVEAFYAAEAVNELYSDADRSNILYASRRRHLELCSASSKELIDTFLPADAPERFREFLKQVSTSQVFAHDVRIIIRGEDEGILSLPWELLLLREDDPMSFAGLRFRIVRCLLGYGVFDDPLKAVLCGLTGASRLGNIPNPAPSRCHFCKPPVTLSAIGDHKRLRRSAAFVLAADRSNDGFCLDHDETPIRRPGFDSNCPSNVPSASLVSLLARKRALSFSAFVVCGRSQEALTLLKQSPAMRASLGLKSNITKTGAANLLNWLTYVLTKEKAVDQALLEYRKQAFGSQSDNWPGGWRDWWLPSLFSKSIEARFDFQSNWTNRILERWGKSHAI